MSRRLEILRAQHAARPEWMKTDNPLVERHRDTGTLRAIGLTIPQLDTAVTKNSSPASTANSSSTASPTNSSSSEYTGCLTGWIAHNPDTYKGSGAPVSGVKWIKSRNGHVTRITQSDDIDTCNLWMTDPAVPGFWADIVAYCLNDKCPE